MAQGGLQNAHNSTFPALSVTMYREDPGVNRILSPSPRRTHEPTDLKLTFTSEKVHETTQRNVFSPHRLLKAQ